MTSEASFRGEKLLLGSHLKLSKVAGDFLAIPGYSIFPMAWEEKKTLPTLRYIYSSWEVIRKFVRLGKVRAFCCFSILSVTIDRVQYSINVKCY